MDKKKQPVALGFLCGIGSMLIGAKKAGFAVLGNFEDRKFMTPESFLNNFPGAFFCNNMDKIDEWPGVDLLIGHPPCGNFSQLTCTAKHKVDVSKRRIDPGRIPDFIQAVRIIKPKYFIMENLPKSKVAYPTSNYTNKLGDQYDLYFEKVENFFYGNSQKFRKRFFVIGALKKEKLIFEQAKNPFPETTVKKVIGDLPLTKDIPEINHVHVDLDEVANIYWGKYKSGKTKKKTYRQIQKILLKLPPGRTPTYINKEGIEKKKIGLLRLYWEKHAHTISAGSWRRACYKYHPITAAPLTIREILRIQGAPDDYIVAGTFEEQILQTGKFIAVEFPTFACKQIINHIKKRRK